MTGQMICTAGLLRDGLGFSIFRGGIVFVPVRSRSRSRQETWQDPGPKFFDVAEELIAVLMLRKNALDRSHSHRLWSFSQQ